MNQVDREKLKCVLIDAEDLLKSAGADNIIILAGVNDDESDVCKTETLISGDVETLCFMLFRCGQSIISDIREEHPFLVHKVEMQCIAEFLSDINLDETTH